MKQPQMSQVESELELHILYERKGWSGLNVS